MKNILILSLDPWLTLRQFKNSSGITEEGDFRLFINDIGCKPDYVVVKGKGITATHVFDVPKERTVLLTGEPYSVLDYPKGFCGQFGTVCACQKELRADAGTNIIHTPAVLSWFVGAAMDNSRDIRFNMNYDDVSNAAPEKTKLISVISSNKAFSQGHVDRLRFIEKLLNRYGDRIDLFGHGFNDFSDKWDVLAPYKYHIAIENSTTDYYWTEKLSDCYLAGTFPLYHGCTNIQDYFPDDAYLPIDIRNFDQTAEVIDRILGGEDIYGRSRRALAASKDLVLGKYNFFNIVADTCRVIDSTNPPAAGQTLIRPASKFFSLHNLYLHTIGRNYYKIVNKLSR